MTRQQVKNESFFVHLAQDGFHKSSAIEIEKVLVANRGCGNGIEEHILNCPACQGILKRKATQ
jgi:hypothetical protein